MIRKSAECRWTMAKSMRPSALEAYALVMCLLLCGVGCRSRSLCSRFASQLHAVRTSPEDGLAFRQAVNSGMDCALSDFSEFERMSIESMNDFGSFQVWTTPDHSRQACTGELLLSIAASLTIDPNYEEYRLDATDGEFSDAERDKLLRLLRRMR